jgi:cellulase
MVQKLASAAFAALLSLAAGQGIGTDTPEVHPLLPTWWCTTAGGCVQQSTSVVLDYNYRWIHEVNSSTDCTNDGSAVQSICPNEATCAASCVVEGADYATSGITTSGDAVTLSQYVTTDGTTNNASPRAYLLGDDGDYVSFQLNGQEIRFDVDVSGLPCGENGALYLSQMDHTGGRTAENPAGANYGAGYCDAQCPVETFINGTLNVNNLKYCCNEMDLWEANAFATALTPHPCEGGPQGTCDSSGCGWNPYAMGETNFYGNSLTVNTLQPFTVVTQFITSDNTTTGALVDIVRYYIQNGQTFQNPTASNGLNSITAAWCDSSDSAADSLGGLTTIGDALEDGMVLIFSIWNDGSQFMNWLDSGSSGPCSSTVGNPTLIEQQSPGTSVTWSNIRWGDIGSTGGETTSSSSTTSTTSTTSSKSTSIASSTTTTTKSTSPTTTACVASTITATVTTTVTVTSSHSNQPPPSTTTTTSKTTTSSASGATQTEYGQCGGTGYTGPTVCAAPYTCQVSNQYYSQCL